MSDLDKLLNNIKIVYDRKENINKLLAEISKSSRGESSREESSREEMSTLKSAPSQSMENINRKCIESNIKYNDKSIEDIIFLHNNLEAIYKNNNFIEKLKKQKGSILDDDTLKIMDEFKNIVGSSEIKLLGKGGQGSAYSISDNIVYKTATTTYLDKEYKEAEIMNLIYNMITKEYRNPKFPLFTLPIVYYAQEIKDVDSKINKVNLFMEKLDTTVDKHIRENTNDVEKHMRYIMLQVISGLWSLCQGYGGKGILRLDCKLDNLMIKKIDGSKKLYFQIFNKCICIDNLGYLVKHIDFGISTIFEHNNNKEIIIRKFAEGLYDFYNKLGSVVFMLDKYTDDDKTNEEYTKFRNKNPIPQILTGFSDVKLEVLKTTLANMITKLAQSSDTCETTIIDYPYELFQKSS